ncbi:hypothetical protein AA0112_g4607 [Alternaria arborescens]|uniref:hypothetical protein n=1 Tax=Alternaria arborescens TaxID=156630 RepID=UPI001074A694|nr:hypothetical protein AA0111_g5591 [Alternaria arborescens]RYN36664.1 hypothetical protein AA0112_g4607 [Alternaria arborescens]RYO30204.1 hypothetical protein AA0111_g5591 [Alternaria arborescens]
MADENYEDDIFDDLYDDEPTSKSAAAAPAPAPKTEPEPTQAEPVSAPPQDSTHDNAQNAAPSWPAQAGGEQDSHMDQSGYNAGGDQSYDNAPVDDDNYGPINVKEDGTIAINGHIGYRARALDNMREANYSWNTLRAQSEDKLCTLQSVAHFKAPGAMVGTESGIKA